jgi:hypothetical protein
VNNNSDSWYPQRKKSLEEQMKQIIKSLDECQKALIYESDPLASGKLEINEKHLKVRLEDCTKDLQSLNASQNIYEVSSNNILNIDFEDIDFIIKYLIEMDVDGLVYESLNLPTPPDQKMSKNSLTRSIRGMLVSGLAQTREVNYLIQSIAQQNFPNLPSKLIATLRSEYTRLIAQGVKGDHLFMGMYDFVGGRHSDPRKKTAGLAILCYFFEACDVFEP